MSLSPYFFSSLDRRPDFVDSADLHPRMETPPVWHPLDIEPIKSVEDDHPWLWTLYAAVMTLAILASAAWPYWITP